jgi:hypothetical protein
MAPLMAFRVRMGMLTDKGVRFFSGPRRSEIGISGSRHCMAFFHPDDWEKP